MQTSKGRSSTEMSEHVTRMKFSSTEQIAKRCKDGSVIFGTREQTLLENDLGRLLSNQIAPQQKRNGGSRESISDRGK